MKCSYDSIISVIKDLFRFKKKGVGTLICSGFFFVFHLILITATSNIHSSCSYVIYNKYYCIYYYLWYETTCKPLFYAFFGTLSVPEFILFVPQFVLIVFKFILKVPVFILVILLFVLNVPDFVLSVEF